MDFEREDHSHLFTPEQSEALSAGQILREAIFVMLPETLPENVIPFSIQAISRSSSVSKYLPQDGGTLECRVTRFYESGADELLRLAELQEDAPAPYQHLMVRLCGRVVLNSTDRQAETIQYRLYEVGEQFGEARPGDVVVLREETVFQEVDLDVFEGDDKTAAVDRIIDAHQEGHLSYGRAKELIEEAEDQEVIWEYEDVRQGELAVLNAYEIDELCNLVSQAHIYGGLAPPPQPSP